MPRIIRGCAGNVTDSKAFMPTNPASRRSAWHFSHAAVIRSADCFRQHCLGLIFAALALSFLGLPVARAQDAAIETVKREVQQFQALRDAGKFKEAEVVIQALVDKYHRSGNKRIEYFCMSAQANFYIQLGRYPEAAPLAETAARGALETWGPTHAVTAAALSHLGDVYSKLNQLEDALATYRRARQAAVASRGADDKSVIALDNSIASDLVHLGRFQEAEPIAQRVLIWEQRHSHGKRTEGLAVALFGLGKLYSRQSRNAEAEKLLKESLAIFESLEKGDRTRTGICMNLLGDLYLRMDRPGDAERLYKQAHALFVELLGPDHPLSAMQDKLADVYDSTGRLDEAERLLSESLAFSDKYYGPESSQSFDIRMQILILYMRTNKLEEADKLSKALLAQTERPGFPPLTLGTALARRILVLQYLDRTDEACQLSVRLIEHEEQVRGKLSGGEQQMSESMAASNHYYDLAADCHLENNKLPEAFAICERGRSRTLLDQMNLAAVDLFAGMAPARAAHLRSVYQEAQTDVAKLAAQISALESGTDLGAEAQRQQLGKLGAQLNAARRNQAEVYAFIRNESPAFRRVVGQNFTGVSLADFQRYLQREQALALYYLVCASRVYVFVIDEKEFTPISLEITEQQAQLLEVAGQELSGQLIGGMLTNAAQTGVLQLVSDPRSGAAPTTKLAALGKILLPKKVLEQLGRRDYQRLIIVPDGPLAMLPFEALVIEEPSGDEQKPKYLLDVAPPVCYAPSATTLITLADRPQTPLPANRDPVLALGDPAYGVEVAGNSAAKSTEPFRSRGGRLSPLPNSGLEARWVAETFAKHGMPAAVLRGREATEAAVRAGAPNRRIVHMACHGLADDEHGNFFGALALAPGAGNGRNPQDDGFLNLNEIYELDLRACDLAILSACQTNYGPRHDGEGIWSLARGFLVAGSRRVIASNWLVDDRAGASLVSYYCGSLTKQPAAEIDYARALTDAKRWTRDQPQWSHPYYWATFVLIGPR